jgi:DNA (cytosine-5)-methyltransferase 1
MRAVDLFAGAGGFSTGAAMAGLKVVWAANHWPEAVQAHSANHPHAEHACQDLNQTDWTVVPRHDVLLASPACQGHSRARGKDRPHHDACRSTAWAVVSCAEAHRPKLIVVENVPEFARWILFPTWRDALGKLGYGISQVVADAADAGVPQHRRRLFVCAALGAAPTIILPIRQHQAAESVIRPSSKWSSVTHLCQRTKEKVARGRARFGERFLIAYYGNESDGRSITRPLGTVTTRDRHALVEGDRLRMLSVEECRTAMGFPETYVLPSRKADAMKMLGNAVVPAVARDVINAALRGMR